MIVKPNQSLLDIILQGCGTMEAGMLVAVDNDFPISYFPVIGSDIAITATALGISDAGTLKYLGQNGIVIGTLGGLIGAPLLTEGGDDIESEDGDVLVGE